MCIYRSQAPTREARSAGVVAVEKDITSYYVAVLPRYWTAKNSLRELSARASHTPTKEIVARLNQPDGIP
jgi:hypothetical protein